MDISIPIGIVNRVPYCFANSSPYSRRVKKAARLESWQVEDARRLRALWDAYKERGGLSQEAFAAEFSIGNQTMVAQYLTPTTPLNLPAAVKFAKGIGCKIDEFSPTLAELVTSALPFATATGPAYVQNPLEGELLRIYRKLNPDNQDQLIGTASRLLNEQTPGKSSPEDPYAGRLPISTAPPKPPKRPPPAKVPAKKPKARTRTT